MKHATTLLLFALLATGLSLWVWVEGGGTPGERTARSRACVLCHGNEWQQKRIPSLRQWQPGTPITPQLQETLQHKHPKLSHGAAPELAEWLARQQLPLLAENSAQSRGEALYRAKCAVCHGNNGEGQEGAYPPLLGSEWLTDEPSRLPEILSRGLRGPIYVRGELWNTTMLPPGLNNDAEIQAVTEYIRQRFTK